MAMSAGAQERQASVVFNHSATQSVGQRIAPNVGTTTVKSLDHSGLRTTSTGGGRWYDYVDSVLALNSSVTQVTNIGGFNLWKDTTATFGYTSSGTPTYYQNKWTSYGMGLDVFAKAWDDTTLFPGQINVTASNSYTVDTVIIFGNYQRSYASAAKTSVNDILRVRLVYGDGTSTCAMPGGGIVFGSPSPYVVDTVNFINMDYDSVNKGANVGTTGLATVANYDITLTSADTATNFFKKIPVNLVVPSSTGGNIVGMSMAFITGDATYPAAGDTVQRADGSMKYNEFFPDIVSDGNGTTINFPPYHPINVDATAGYFKQEGANSGDADGWTGQFLPNWAWTSSNPSAGSPSAFQYLPTLFHVTCATCALMQTNVGVSTVKNITSVTAVPNPANTQVTINFTLVNNSQVTISLTDMLGNTVATQNVANIGSGKATINTANLADGVYFYTVTANGERQTGRVAIAH